MILDPAIKRFLDGKGSDLIGFSRYRLVWSDSQFEWRKGTFNEFSGSLFLRTSVGVRLVPKYPYVKSRWILEKYFPPEIAYTEALPESREGLYEPLFVFQDKESNALPVTIKVLEVLIAFDRKYSGSTVQKACEDSSFASLQETREFNELLDSIDTSVIQSQLHMKEAIVKP